MWTDGAGAKGCRAFGDESEGVAANRVVKGGKRLLRNLQAGSSYSRSVEQAQRGVVLECKLTGHADQAAKALAIGHRLLQPQAERRKGRIRGPVACPCRKYR